MTSVTRALVISLIERYLLIAIALSANIILARLLSPEQIGAYSVGIAIIGIAQVVRDFGVGSFLIQESRLTEDHIRTAFGISLMTGGILFLAVLGAADWIGRLYEQPGISEILRIVSLNFLVLPFCTISLALLRRDMQFRRLLYVNISAAILGFIITISLAYAGLGAKAMAIGSVATNAATGFGAWLTRQEHRVFSPSLRQWRTLLGFGTQTSIAGIVTSISIDINDLVIGKVIGLAPVAIISRAQGIANIFHRDIMGAIRNVALPAFAAAHRRGEPVERHYVLGVASVTAFAWPFYGFSGLFAIELLRLLFGPQWDAAAPLVPLFCIAGAIAATSNLITSAILAVGRVDLLTFSEVAFQPLRALLVIAAAITTGSLWACAAAYLAAFALYTPFIYIIKQRCIPSDYRSLRQALLASAYVSAAALAGPLIIAVYAGLLRGEPTSIQSLGIAAITCILGWLVALPIFKHPLLGSPLFAHIIPRRLRAN